MGNLKVIGSRADEHVWLKARTNYVTASEGWMMVCESKDGRDLWADLRMQKAGLSDEWKENEAMFWGSALEPAVMDKLNEAMLKFGGHDYALTPMQLLVEDPDCGSIAATLDMFAWNHPRWPGVPVPVDLKIGGYAWTVTKDMKEDAEKKGVDPETLSPVREYAQVQSQIQMACTGAPGGMIVRLAPKPGAGGFGNKIDHWTFERHDELIDTLRMNAVTMMGEVKELREMGQ